MVETQAEIDASPEPEGDMRPAVRGGECAVCFAPPGTHEGTCWKRSKNRPGGPPGSLDALRALVAEHGCRIVSVDAAQALAIVEALTFEAQERIAAALAGSAAAGWRVDVQCSREAQPTPIGRIDDELVAHVLDVFLKRQTAEKKTRTK